MTPDYYKAIGDELFAQLHSVTDPAEYNKKVREVRRIEEKAVIETAGAAYQNEIDRIDEQIAILKAQKRGLEVAQARACKKAWIKHFGDSCGFPTVLRMVLGETIRG